MDVQKDIWDKMYKTAPFSPTAYAFVLDGIGGATERLCGPQQGKRLRHVSGQQLCIFMRDLALDRYGPLSLLVLNHWGVGSTDDIGLIVFALANQGFVGTSDSDAVSDFHNVYDFAIEFRENPL